MTAPNLYAEKIATTDFVDRADILASGFVETGSSAANSLAVSNTVTPFIGDTYVTITSATTAATNIDLPHFTVTPGETLIWGVRQQRRSGAARTHRLDWRFYSDAAGTVSLATNGTITGSSATTSAPGTWAQTVGTATTVPDGAVTARPRIVYLATNTPAVGDRLAINAIQVERGSTLSDEIVAPTPEPVASSGILIPFGAGWTDAEMLTSWATATTDDAIRAETNAPINETDELVQAGNFSSFVTVTTHAALTAALLDGQRCFVNTTFDSNSQVRMVSGSAIYLGPNGHIRKTYASSGSTASSFIRTNNINSGNYLGRPVTPSHDVYIGGPGRISSATTAATGNVLGLAGDRIVLDSFGSALWAGGRYVVGIGNDWRVRRVNWTGGKPPAGQSGSGIGGLRFMGGSRFRCIDSHVDSGDDCWQFVPAGGLDANGNPGDPFFSVDIDDGIYLGCTGSSASGRFLIIGNQDGLDDGVARMYNDVTNIKFIACDGYSGGAALAIQNKSSSGEIAHITYDRCTIDGSQTAVTTGQPGAVFFNNVNGMGGVHHVDLIDTEVINHHRPGLRHGPGTQAGLHHISFTGGRLERSTAQASEPIIEITNGSDWSMSGTVLNRRGSTSTAVVDTTGSSSLSYTLIN